MKILIILAIVAAILVPPINGNLPTCDPNPKHDFGKCKKDYDATSSTTLQKVMDHCQVQQRGGAVSDIGLEWWNATHYIDNDDCEFYDRVVGSPTYGQIISPKNSQVTGSDESADEQICGAELVLINGICMPIHVFRVDDPSFSKQNLQTGETISNPEVLIIIESLGAILIALFIIIYTIKKRMKKNER